MLGAPWRRGEGDTLACLRRLYQQAGRRGEDISLTCSYNNGIESFSLNGKCCNAGAGAGAMQVLASQGNNQRGVAPSKPPPSSHQPNRKERRAADPVVIQKAAAHTAKQAAETTAERAAANAAEKAAAEKAAAEKAAAEKAVPAPLSEKTGEPSLGPAATKLRATCGGIALPTPPKEKQILCRRLVPQIKSMYPDLSNKILGWITCMLAELDNVELEQMLKDQHSLKVRVDEARVVLQAHLLVKPHVLTSTML